MTIPKDENKVNLNNKEILQIILDNTSEINKKDIIIKSIDKISKKLNQNSSSSQKKTKLSFQDRKYIIFFVCFLILIIIFILFFIK